MSHAPAAPSATPRAVAIMFIAMSCIPAGDSAGKLLSAYFDVAPIFVAWSRFVLGAVLILPFVARPAWALLRNPWIWGRAALLAMGISSIQMALARAPLADVFAAFFIGPLLSYALASVFLREPITRTRTALIVLGFIGVLVVIRPSADMNIGMLWALMAGLCYGAFLTASRALSHLGSPIALTFTQLFIAAILLTPLGIGHIPTFTPQVSGLIALSAAFSMLGNLLLLVAYSSAPATRMAPLVYFQLLAAVALGWFIFETWPDLLTWIGLLIVMGAGIASARLKA